MTHPVRLCAVSPASSPTPCSTRPRARGSLSLWFAVLLGLAALPASAATIVVDSAHGGDIDDDACALREAILAANTDVDHHGCPAGDGTDRIEFDLPAGAVIELTSSLPPVTESLTIAGPGRNELVIDGNQAVSILWLQPDAGMSASLVLEDLTLTGALAQLPGGYGGALTVHPGGEATVRRVTLRGNTAEGAGGAILVFGQPPVTAALRVEECLFEDNVVAGVLGGGAIFGLDATIEIVRSTFSGNFAAPESSPSQSRGGGAIAVVGTDLTVRASTVSGNEAVGIAGGILAAAYEGQSVHVTIEDSTVFDNDGDSDGDDIGAVGGVAMLLHSSATGSLRLRNSIVAGNRDSGTVSMPDLAWGSTAPIVVTDGFNLIGESIGIESHFPAGLPNAFGDYVGTPTTPAPAVLEALETRGGALPVHLPIPSTGSLVIDKGNCAFSAFDQRGYVDPVTQLRPVDEATISNSPGGTYCDIGAVEYGAVAPDDSDVFMDGFESGSTGAWSTVVDD